MSSSNPFIAQPYHLWGVVSQLLFGAYILWVQPWVLSRLLGTSSGETDTALGAFLLIIQGVEVLGIWLKQSFIRGRLGILKSNQTLGFMAVFLIAMAHFLLGFMLTFYALKALGFGLSSDEPFWKQGVALAVMFLALGKEGAIFSWILVMVSKSEKPTQQETNSQLIIPWKELFADILLLLFSMLAYTGIWEFIASQTPLHPERSFAFVMELFGAGMFFIMIYLPLRMLYFVEEFLLPSTWIMRLQTLIGVGSAMVAAIASIPLTGR